MDRLPAAALVQVLEYVGGTLPTQLASFGATCTSLRDATLSQPAAVIQGSAAFSPQRFIAGALMYVAPASHRMLLFQFGHSKQGWVWDECSHNRSQSG